ncbi:MAG TPA: hypothetical protein VL400_00715, partial [Polyangiaceae bacterium]|nr:hypothetical protein [Polyangiaceae bacterium]
MLNFKSTIGGLDAAKGARLEATSGKRARIVTGDDVRTLGEDLLSEDGILDACRMFGGARFIDELSARPVSWVANGPSGAIRITLVLRGRDVSATFTPVPPRHLEAAHAQPERKKSLPPRKMSTRVAAGRCLPPPRASERPQTGKRGAERETQREMSAVRPENVRRETPRARPSQRASRSSIPAQPRREEPRREEPRRAAHPPPAPEPPAPAPAHAPAPAPARGPSRDRPPRVEQALMDLLVAAKRFEASDIHLAPGQPPALRVA